MNETTTNGAIKVPEYVKEASVLMQEYTEKLAAIVKASRVWMNVFTEGGQIPDARLPLPDELESTSRFITPAVTELARSVSGMIEHGRVDGLEKIQLRLRLAELEAAIHNAHDHSIKAKIAYDTVMNASKSSRKK